jgi:predicted acyltransferase
MPPEVQSPSRNLAIDRFRGALVILMVGGDYLSGVQLVPAYLKHAADVGFTVADTVASAFVFAIGLTFASSFERRRREGGAAAYRHFVVRYLTLIGIGAILTAGGTSVAGVHTDWGVLQALGLAGLICLAFIRLQTWARFVSGVLLLVVYQLALDAWWLDEVVRSTHGGFLGAISWAALLVLSTAVADLWRRGRAPYMLCCALLALAAVISVLAVPVSKHRVSLSFVLLTLAISAVAFLLVDLASKAVPSRAGFLAWWGENALALYILHLLVLALVTLPAAPWWYAQAPNWLAATQLSVVFAALSVAAWWLHRRGIRIAL